MLYQGTLGVLDRFFIVDCRTRILCQGVLSISKNIPEAKPGVDSERIRTSGLYLMYY